jgi:hypothetical protein
VDVIAVHQLAAKTRATSCVGIDSIFRGHMRKAASSASGLCSSPLVDMQGGDAKDGVRPPEGKRHETVGHAPPPQTKQRMFVPTAHT